MPLIGVQFRRDSTEAWERENPVLEPGEIGLEVESINPDGTLSLYVDAEGEAAFKMKLGDGITPWRDLPYAGGVRGPQGLPGRDGIDGKDGKDGRDGIDGEKGDTGPAVAISDSVTSNVSSVAASLKAVKTAYDLAKSHNHSAANITSGTLAAERGGTGRTDGKVAALATARTIGTSGAATGTPTSFDGLADIVIPITGLDVSKASAGTLSVIRGGTGQTTAAGIRNSLGLGNTTGAVPIANGGTGATTAAAAATALGAVTAVNMAASGSGNVVTNITSKKSGNVVTLTFTKASVVNSHCTYCSYCTHCSYCACSAQCDCSN